MTVENNKKFDVSVKEKIQYDIDWWSYYQNWNVYYSSSTEIKVRSFDKTKNCIYICVQHGFKEILEILFKILYSSDSMLSTFRHCTLVNTYCMKVRYRLSIIVTCERVDSSRLIFICLFNHYWIDKSDWYLVFIL